MTELFGFDGTHYVPELNAGWFLDDPGVAYRQYEGIPLRHTKEGWQYQQPLEWTIGENGQMWQWENIYPRITFTDVLFRREVESNFAFVEEFENAASPYTREYELGDYTLVQGSPWTLIPATAEQISNLNDLDLKSYQDVSLLYSDLRHACWPLRNEVYGVTFISDSGTATLDPRLFDWSDYD